MNTPTFNYIKKMLTNQSEYKKLLNEFFNFEDNMMYIFSNYHEMVLCINDWLLETYPAHAGMIDYGATKDLEVTMASSRPSYYISIPIYPEGE